MLKKLAKDLISNKPFKWLNGKRFIVCYHDISEDNSPHFAAGVYSTRPAEFRAHMEFYKKFCRVVPLHELLLNNNLPDDRILVSITFDDGFRSFLTAGLPVMQVYGFQPTLFLNKEAVLNNQLWVSNLVLHRNNRQYLKKLYNHFLTGRCSEDEFFEYPLSKLMEFHFEDDSAEVLRLEQGDLPAGTYLNLDEVKEIRYMGIPIGNHSNHHFILSHCSDELQEFEIISNKQFLEGELGVKITDFGIPFGKKEHFNNTTVSVCTAGGQPYVYSSNVNPYRPGEEHDLIPRIALTNESPGRLAFYFNRTLFRRYDI